MTLNDGRYSEEGRVPGAAEPPRRVDPLLTPPPPEAFGGGELAEKRHGKDGAKKGSKKKRSKSDEDEADEEDDDSEDKKSSDGDDEESEKDKESDSEEDDKDEDDDKSDKDEKKGKDGGKNKKKKKPLYKRPVAMTVLILIVLLLAIAILLYWIHSKHYESTDDAFIEGHAIAISPKVSAIVDKVHIDDNYLVKKGDLLIELDPRDYQAALAQAQGNFMGAQGRLEEAKAQIDVGKAQVGQAQAQVAVQQANADNAQRDLQRYLNLDERARSRQQLDNASAAAKSLQAQVEQAKAQLTAAEATLADSRVAVDTAIGNLTTAQGALDQAKLNLSYCRIYAHDDGIITRKNVEPGMYVTVDEPLFSIVPTDVWVIANFKETQLQRLELGQAVTMEVDAYPGRKLHGKIESVQNGTGSRFSLLPPENATGNYVKIVQRVPVKITLDPDQNNDANHLLIPGMSVDPVVDVQTRPNAAQPSQANPAPNGE